MFGYAQTFDGERSSMVGVGVVMTSPDLVCRKRRVSASSLQQELPKILCAVGVIGEASSEADNGQRLCTVSHD